MIRYNIIILALIVGAANAGEFGECGYIPKPTEQLPSPEWEMFKQCALYEDGVLRIAKEHLANLDFGDKNITSLFAAGQHFYLKPDGRFLPVIAYDNGADPYREGLTRSLLDGKIAYYNMDLKLVLAPGYDWAWPFEDGRAMVCRGCAPAPTNGEHTAVTGGVWGYIDKNGKEVVQVKYSTTEISSK
jgi:hypothetical protein